MCLKLVLRDGSIADADAFVVEETRYDFVNHFLNSTTLNYTFVAPKPVEKDLNRHYDVAVSLLHGKCSDKSLRLRAGDYYSEYLNFVRLTADEDEYVMDVNVTSKYQRISKGPPKWILSDTDRAGELTLKVKGLKAKFT